MSVASSGAIKRAYAWTAAGTTIRNLLGFVISLLLARLLDPKDYGLMGMVIVFTSFLAVVQDSSLSQAIIYFKEDEHPDILPTHYAVNIVSGFLLAAITIVVAPWIAGFYEMPALTALAQVMSLSFVFTGFRAVSQSLLVKRFLFRDVMIVETVSGVAAAVVALVMAWMGFGVWSLVTNLVLAAFLQMVLVIAREPLRWTFRPHWPSVRRIFRWGLPLTGSSVSWKLYDNADYMIIGKMLGEQALGIYTLAFRLATLVNDKIGVIVARVSFPSFASMQDARGQAIHHWYTLTRILTTITFPLLAALAVNAHDFVLVVLSEKWLAAAEPIRFLCVVGAMKSITPMTNNLLAGLGDTGTPFRFSLINLLVLPPAFVVGCYLAGITGVGIAWMVAFPPICAWLIVRAVKHTKTKMSAYLSALRFPVMATAACTAAMLLAGAFLPPGLLRLIVRSLAGAACYALCLYLDAPSRDQMSAVIAKIRARVAAA